MTTLIHKMIFGRSRSFKPSLLSLLTVCLLCTSGLVKAQQEPMYSQYMFNMLHVNPAYAGSRAVDNITLLYRNQWVGLPGAPKTGTISWDRRGDDSNVGYGLEVYSDKLGVETTTGFQAFYSYHVPFENSYLSMGLSAGLLNYRAAYSEAQTNTGGDPVFQADVNGWLPTAGFGLVYVAPAWYVGLSVPALLNTKVTSAGSVTTSGFGASNHYFLTGGYDFVLNENMKLKPSVMIKAVKGSPVQYDLNTNWWFKDMFGLGISYRHADAVVGMLEIQISPKLRLGYSYDYTISDFRAYSKGTHEVMLRWEIPNSNYSRKGLVTKDTDR
jgi:type IX secretion system PorP/SprF family membrane protein